MRKTRQQPTGEPIGRRVQENIELFEGRMILLPENLPQEKLEAIFKLLEV
jgi:hypothetical protein